MDPTTTRVLVSTGLLVAVLVGPLALIGAAAAEGSALRSLTFLAQLGVFLVAGAMSVRRAPGAPVSVAAGVAVLGWAVVQVVAIVVALLGDREVRWATLPFLALFVATTGLVGGLFASWRGRRHQADWRRR